MTVERGRDPRSCRPQRGRQDHALRRALGPDAPGSRLGHARRAQHRVDVDARAGAARARAHVPGTARAHVAERRRDAASGARRLQPAGHARRRCARARAGRAGCARPCPRGRPGHARAAQAAAGLPAAAPDQRAADGRAVLRPAGGRDRRDRRSHPPHRRGARVRGRGRRASPRAAVRDRQAGGRARRRQRDRRGARQRGLRSARSCARPTSRTPGKRRELRALGTRPVGRLWAPAGARRHRPRRGRARARRPGRPQRPWQEHPAASRRRPRRLAHGRHRVGRARPHEDADATGWRGTASS